MTRIFKSIVSATLLCLVGLTYGSVVKAQSSATTDVPQIGFVLLSKVFRESQYVANIRQGIDAEFVEREQALQAKIDEFTRLRENETSLTQDVAAGDASVDLDELEREIKREDRNLSEDKRSRYDEANREVERQVGETIQKVAASHQLFMVFELSSVLYAERRLDITDEVIAELDKLDTSSEQTTQSQ